MDALDDIVVLELSTGIAGPYAGKLFADAGARVIKVEPPGGDELRRRAPAGVDLGGDDSALFQHLNAGKESVIGGPGDPGVEGLLGRADLVIESFTPAHPIVASWRDRHPALVVLSITPFGRTGPWRDRPSTGFTLQAESGSIASRGRPGQPPFQAGGRLAEWAAGVCGAAGALAAVLHSRAGRGGEHVDCALLAVDHMITNANVCMRDSFLGHPAAETPPRMIDVPGIEPTSDGYVGFNANTRQQLAAFLALVGQPDLLDREPDWASADYRLRHADEFNALTRPWIRARTTAEVLALAAQARIPVAPVNNGATLPEQEQFTARGVIGPMPGGAFVHPLPPYRIDGARPPVTRRAPRPGTGVSPLPPRPATAAPGSVSAPGSGPDLPLTGLRVLDATSMWAGPVVGQLFAALGAEVIHLESVQRLDLSRLKVDHADRVPQWWERGHTWFMVNFNKRDLTLDLSRPDGRELLERLLPSCDVLVENYAPRVFEKFGLTADRVRAINPELIYARMPAFGLDGPWRDLIGFAQTMEQMSGLAWLTGPAEADAPVVPRGPCDPLAGYQTMFALLVALVRRGRGMGGCLVEAAMAESAVNAAAESVVDYSAYGVLHRWAGNRGDDAAPQGLYQCGPEQWIAISVERDQQWDALTRVLGRPGWAQAAALSTADGRRAAADEIDWRLACWAAGRGVEQTVADLVGAGVPAAALTDPRRADEHPQLTAWGYFEPVEHPILGSHRVPTLPFRYAGVDRWVRSPAPRLGQHNGEILGGWLRLPDAELGRLRADGVIGAEPLGSNPTFDL
ncbi:MAG TPA: CoA transferase [Trebonia sp.]|jgi:crotonobetainyl-CoA:carnitine CoA-transferase CaiB-like acyl-CoA transferase|nr:CoA transferase [Trebonia sp.]